MQVYDILKQKEITEIIIIGTAKNAGKTSTLNHLINSACRQGEKLGLTSTGLDGEPLDYLTGKKKPRIYCPEGTVIATAREALKVSTATFDNIETAGVSTSLGEVVVADVSKEGFVELVGPLYARELKILLEMMSSRQVVRTIVDGSLDRKAAGRIIDNVILATGAINSRDMNEAVEKTRDWVKQLTILPPPPGLKNIISTEEHNIKENNPGYFILESKNIKAFPFKSLLGKGKELSILLKKYNPLAIYTTGALGETTFEEILRHNKMPVVIINNASSLFIKPGDWRQFLKRGGKIYATRPLKLIAVTVNPVSPEGWKFPKDEFLKAVQQEVIPYPTFNPGPWNL